MPSFSTLTLTDDEASSAVVALGHRRMETSNEEYDRRLQAIQFKITDGRYMASTDKLLVMAELMATVRRVVAETQAINNRLNDPHGDGTGNHPRSPTGDDYNRLLDLVEELGRFCAGDQ